MGRKNKNASRHPRRNRLNLDVKPRTGIYSGTSRVVEATGMSRMDARRRLSQGESPNILFAEFQKLQSESRAVFSNKEQRVIGAQARGIAGALKEHFVSNI